MAGLVEILQKEISNMATNDVIDLLFNIIITECLVMKDNCHLCHRKLTEKLLEFIMSSSLLLE